MNRMKTTEHVSKARGRNKWIAVAAIALSSISSEFARAAAAAQQAFATPQAASEALIKAASSNNTSALIKILGPDGKDLVVTQDKVQDKNHALKFAAQARQKEATVLDPKNPDRATLVVGKQDWPVPIPIVKTQAGWQFDSKAGQQEVLKRRIGANELDAITIARGYVEAQQQYADQKHDGSGVNQYAQKMISTPGKHDGLAWKNKDGSWGGPAGENVAKAISQGYSSRSQPYHGYYFKVLKGQGPSAYHGNKNYVVDGAMIGGFALVAWPAEYGVTGIKTFIVSYDGVVYQKDLGPDTTKIASSMDRYDPNQSWTRTDDEWA